MGFVKIEATKFTEIRYVGKDVDSIVRDLLDISIKILKRNIYDKFIERAIYLAKMSLLNCLIEKNSSNKIKNICLKEIDSGSLDEQEIEISVEENMFKNSSFSPFDIPGIPGSQVGIVNINDVLGKNFNNK